MAGNFNPPLDWAQDVGTLAREGVIMSAGNSSTSTEDGRATGPEGEQPFLEALAKRYRSALNRFFERRAPSLRNESEDLTQEVFVRLAQRNSGAEIAHVEGYLFQTAANVLTDRVRHRTVRHMQSHDLYDEDLHALEDFSPEQILLAREQLLLVRKTLQQLPERVRVAFVLHRFEELTYAEIAKRLGVSVSAVEKYIMRALKEITASTRGEQ